MEDAHHHHVLAHSGLLCVVPAKRHRTQADASWIQPQCFSALLVDRIARLGRRPSASGLHVPAPADRHPQDGGHHLTALRDPHAGLVLRCPGQHHPLRRSSDACLYVVVSAVRHSPATCPLPVTSSPSAFRVQLWACRAVSVTLVCPSFSWSARSSWDLVFSV